MDEPIINGDKRNPDGTFAVGHSGGPGRPIGSVSPITKVKQIFEANPETFAQFVSAYMSDPNNRKHVVEMIDGKPKQDVNLDGNMTQYVIERGDNLSSAQEPEDNSNTLGAV